MRHRNRIAPHVAATAFLFGTLLSPAVHSEESKKHWWTPRLRDGAVEANETHSDAPATPSPTPAPAPETKPAAQAATPPATPSKAAAGPAAAPTAPAAPPSVFPNVVVPSAPSALGNSAKPPVRIPPDPDLLKTCRILKAGPVGADANARAYIELIETNRATPAQINDFAAYLAKRGAPKLALQCQTYATKLDPTDSTLALNLGTLYQNLNQLSDAEGAFRKAIELDPNNALAHYNLGATYDARKNYDNAVEQYRIALVLDPSLGDARKNPQIVNNERLLVVKTEIYQNLSGALGLPLKQMQANPPASKAPSPAEKK